MYLAGTNGHPLLCVTVIISFFQRVLVVVYKLYISGREFGPAWVMVHSLPEGGWGSLSDSRSESVCTGGENIPQSSIKVLLLDRETNRCALSHVPLVFSSCQLGL